MPERRMPERLTTERPTSARRRRSLLGGGLAIVLSVLLAACGGIPTSGGVGNGGPIDAEADVEIGFAPEGPQDGASQEEIMLEFINAATNPQGNYSVARQFLSSTFAAEWDPDAVTLIRSGNPLTQSIGEVDWTYTIDTIARVERDGKYTEDTAGSDTLAFTFVLDDGEWRISSAPTGIVLSEDRFVDVFRPYPLFYFDPTYQFLVPDMRWFATRSGVSIRVASALLAGQRSQFSQALISEFPPGTTLGENLVDIDSGVATVDLSEEARGAEPLTLDRMRQQLAMTLATSSVVLTIGGSPVSVDDGGQVAAISSLEVEASPLVLTDDRFGFADGSSLRQIGQLSNKVVGVRPVAATLARDKALAAVLGLGGVYAVANGSAPAVLVDDRPGLAAPSVDSLGYIWSAPRSNALAIRTFGADGTVHEVSSTLPADARVISLDVSRDGARLLLYLSTTAGPRLAIAGISRGQDGVPVGIGELLDLPVDESTPVDATWVDGSTVASLSRSEDGTIVRSYVIGGPSEYLGQLDNGDAIVGGNGGVGGLRVHTTEGEILRPRSNGWQSTGISASFIATQQ